MYSGKLNNQKPKLVSYRDASFHSTHTPIFWPNKRNFFSRNPYSKRVTDIEKDCLKKFALSIDNIIRWNLKSMNSANVFRVRTNSNTAPITSKGADQESYGWVIILKWTLCAEGIIWSYLLTSLKETDNWENQRKLLSGNVTQIQCLVSKCTEAEQNYILKKLLLSLPKPTIIKH